MNIIKGDKLPVVLIKKNPIEGTLINKNTGGMDFLEQFYSGWFYVKGFKIKYNKNIKSGSLMSNYTQNFVLTRREWPPPIAVDGLSANEK